MSPRASAAGSALQFVLRLKRRFGKAPEKRRFIRQRLADRVDERVDRLEFWADNLDQLSQVFVSR